MWCDLRGLGLGGVCSVVRKGGAGNSEGVGQGRLWSEGRGVV